MHDRLVVADSIHAALGGTLVAELGMRLLPLDCQTCGEEFPAAERPALAVDDVDLAAFASLHHQDCRPSEWRYRTQTEAESLGFHVSWRAKAVLWQAADEAMILVNPSGEVAVLTREHPPRNWRVSTLDRYVAAGFVRGGGGPVRPPAPSAGLDVRIDPERGAVVTAASELLGDLAWHTGMPDEVFGTAYARRQFVVGVTTALDPMTESVTETRLGELLRRGEIVYTAAALGAEAGEVGEIPVDRVMALLEMIRRRLGVVPDEEQLANALALHRHGALSPGVTRPTGRDLVVVVLLVAGFFAGGEGPVHVMTAADDTTRDLIDAGRSVFGGAFPVSRIGEMSFTSEQRVSVGTYAEFADDRARFDDGSAGFARVRPLALAVDPVPQDARVGILRRYARLVEFTPPGTLSELAPPAAARPRESAPATQPVTPDVASINGEQRQRARGGTVPATEPSAVPLSYFPDGTLDPYAGGDPGGAGAALDGAVRRFDGLLRGSDLLHVVAEGCLAGRWAGIRTALELALVPGARLEDVRDVVDVYNPAGDGTGFDGTPANVAPELLAALSDAADTAAGGGPALRPVGLELLLACVLDRPDERDREHLTILDFPAAAQALRRRVRLSAEPLPSLWDEPSGRLRSEAFTDDAWAVLEHSARIAADLGHDMVLTPHCLLALLTETEGLADRVLRRQLPPHLGVAKATETISTAFRLPERERGTVPGLHRDEIGASLGDVLRTAQSEVVAWRGEEQVDVPHLLLALLGSPSQRLAGVLRAEPLNLDLERLRDHLLEAMRESRGAAPREAAYTLPSALPPAEDLTWLARTRALPGARHVDGYVDALCRALHRGTDRHVLLTGLPGVGRTTVLRELARRAAAGEIPFLRRRRFVRVDCRGVAPEQSRKQLESLLDVVGGRTDMVLCVDGLGALLRGPNGVRHNALLHGALVAGRVHLVGVLTGHDYEDLVATDRELLDLTTRIEVAEPDRAAATDMARQAADELTATFDVEVSDTAVRRAVVLAGDFIRRQHLPQSAVKVLRRACENLDYDRVHGGAGAPSAVGTDGVVRAVAELSGVPAGQLGGVHDDVLDHEGLLGDRVLGQDEAVRALAQELRRIKSGLAAATPGPASVMLFAGLTGVGKTELAKAVADLYSASKRLQTYPMGNFTEPHSVAAVLGPPPGYVGHEGGGRLINELNADPYCVVLLDEAEKAHPEVLRPFLNLFDEGWIVDQRGVKAYGDRAIFILTTNAGHGAIARLPDEATQEEGAAAVRDALRAIRTRNHEPVFTPELLARIRRVVVFRPLGPTAMEGICRQEIDRQRAFWRERRDKDLVVAEDIVRHMARTGDRLNTRAGGGEGGRIIRKILGDVVEDPITLAERDRPAEFQACDTIELRFAPAAPHVEVLLHGSGGAW
ncbi:AAA family ATPase [Streptomyces noursei]|uniref:AAA family ATPase n=1 Tax=Streptomyces noursei TaxID=1971 RepID=UPI00380BD26A